MTRRFLDIFVAIALVLAIGGHWALVQSVAWLRMAVSYSKSAPLYEALRMTFDGRHPCQLCKVVQAEKTSSEEKQTSTQPGKSKLDLLCRATGIPLLTRPAPGCLICADEIAAARIEAPPTPPPRQA